MQVKIHNQNWHYLTGEQIVGLFDKFLGGVNKASDTGVQVTIQPNMNIVMALKELESATLELIENRTGSTVYRIRETGFIYQLFQPNGDMFTYADYEEYQQDDPVDELIALYASKEPVHVLHRKKGNVWVQRIKPPRFKARYVPGNSMSNFTDFEWEDKEPADPLVLARLLRKAGAFIVNTLKHK